MRRLLMLAAVALVSTFAANAAPAQDKTLDMPVEATSPKLDPKACADRERLTEGDTHESQGLAPREPLGDKLARTDGVICPPPGLDPDIHQPAPGGGSMKVIPPPGSPGGDPNVRPK